MKTRLFPVLIMIILLTPAYGQERETRETEDFTIISLHVSANVYLKQGNNRKVVLEGSASDLEKIETYVDGKRLRVKSKNNFFTSMGKVDIFITIPEIEGLEISGSGDIIAETPVKTGDFHMKISGSGDITISELVAAAVKAAISGSGDIEMEKAGNAEKLSIAISGSGDIDLRQLAANNVDIVISGSGDCNVNATGKLGVKISGSGDVYYKGKPVVNAEVSGSGKIQHI